MTEQFLLKSIEEARMLAIAFTISATRTRDSSSVTLLLMAILRQEKTAECIKKHCRHLRLSSRQDNLKPRATSVAFCGSPRLLLEISFFKPGPLMDRDKDSLLDNATFDVCRLKSARINLQWRGAFQLSHQGTRYMNNKRQKFHVEFFLYSNFNIKFWFNIFCLKR